VIVSTTPGTTIQGQTPIPREKMRCANKVIAGSGIPIVHYDPPEQSGLSSITLKPMIELNVVKCST